MPQNTTANYPFWSPQGAGSAERFAEPWNLTAIQLAGHVYESRLLIVPQEVVYSQREVPLRQEIVPVVPEAQGPGYVPDLFAQSRSLLDYAQQTLGGSRIAYEDNRGQSGQTDITGR